MEPKIGLSCHFRHATSALNKIPARRREDVRGRVIRWPLSPDGGLFVDVLRVLREMV